MSIKPVDFQVMLPRTMEVAKVHNEVEHKNQALLKQQASLIQHKAENNLKQVYTQENAQEARIREKQEKERRERKKEDKKKKQGENKSNIDTKSGERTSTIDIRL